MLSADSDLDDKDGGLASPALVDQIKDLDELLVTRSRVDPATFAAYVLRDEETGSVVHLQELHKEWHRLANAHRRLLLWSTIESGKTQQMSIARSLFEIGKNPNLRIVIVSNTDSQAMRICKTIGNYIESSPELHKVFPHLKRDTEAEWTKHSLHVVRTSQAKDPSVRTCGVHGNILGARIDLLVVDDILDYENTISPHQREDLKRWYSSTLEGRLTRQARVLCIGTAWHPDDMMHYWAKRPEWMAVRYPVLDERGYMTWPERWPMSRIMSKKDILGPVEYARQLLCVARSDDEARFHEGWIKQCLARGLGRTLTYALEDVPDGYRTYTGVDLGVSQKDSADLTVLFTIIIHPDESREILDIQAGHWTSPEIVSRIIDTHYRYHSIVLVENNAAQDYIVQFTRGASAVPVESFTTTGAKKANADFGIESLAAEMAAAKWIIPSNIDGSPVHPEISNWINEMLYYDPKGHTGDRLMASWFAREGARKKRPKGAQGAFKTLNR